MEKVSQTLRQAREQRNMTLEEVAQQTRIPLSYLMALEGKGLDSRQRTRLLPDPFYLIPHLRRYAVLLGVDVNSIVAQFTMEIQDIQEGNNKIASTNQPPQILGPSPHRSHAISLSIILASVLVTLALIGQYSDLPMNAPIGEEERTVTPSSSPLETQTQTPTPSPATAPSAVQPSPSSQTPNAAPLPSASSTENVTSEIASSTSASNAGAKTPQSQTASPTSTALVDPATGRSPHLLQARAKEATWIRVLMEGQPTKEMILQPGQSASWSSDSAFLITLGNAGGVTLTINGQELPPLGKSGQVLRNIRLPFSPTDAQG